MAHSQKSCDKVITVPIFFIKCKKVKYVDQDHMANKWQNYRTPILGLLIPKKRLYKIFFCWSHNEVVTQYPSNINSSYIVSLKYFTFNF